MVSKRRRTLIGQGLVEFALVSPLFFLMVFGVIEGGRLVWTMHTLTNATREGSRYALVHGSMSGDIANAADVKTHMLDHSSGLDSDELTVVVTFPDGGCNDPKCPVVVDSSYEYSFIVGMVFGAGTITLESVSEAIIAY